MIKYYWNKINRNFTSKHGRLEFVIQSNWSKIVGSYFDNFSEPKNISRVTNHESDLGDKVYKSYNFSKIRLWLFLHQVHMINYSHHIKLCHYY